MKRNERIRYSKKRIKEVTKLLQSKIEKLKDLKGDNLKRFLQLFNYCDAVNKINIIKHHKDFNIDNYLSINPATLIALMPEFKDDIKREFRRFEIQSSMTFSCPISKEILDLDRSIFINAANNPTKEKKEVLLSFGGFYAAVTKKGLKDMLSRVIL